MLEMIVMLSMLVGLSFGAVEYGDFFYVKNVVVGAAREGARAGMISGATNTNVTTAVSKAMTSAGIASSHYTLTISPWSISGAATGTAITVTVSCTWGTVGITPLPVSLGGIPSTKQVVASIVMRRQ